MRKLYLLIFLTTYFSTVRSQNITVTGECINSPALLNKIADVDGKVAYEGTGTVDGNVGVVIDVYWIGAPDNVWVVAFDGQPYFQNSCNTIAPPGTGNAACLWSAVSGQTCTGGTALAVTGSGVLPITISNFTAGINNNQVTLKWKTASENNNKGFEIQRSQDGLNWDVLGFVSGNINSSVEKKYEFVDMNPLSGTGFYRLRQVDQDEKFSYSAVASVKYLKANFYSIIRNNGNNRYQLNIEPATQPVNLSVIDAGGKKLMTKSGVAGIQYIDISHFPSGIYLLQIAKGTTTFTEKLIKF
ncbi:T9SS type A sorting domain-containing protein [Ferruginibacter paludis]|uniref:T9SS type A sorting domain-containing protein n=1 Tax=Ferruginibacter paludis TaxID=1310417 RepID=UPI0025B5357E|nr:T9SS type A sorting domain-containing protein [Ferruginibacter paludis]MDN3658236.1 T9SS type A sorting domain-containing protein [Ferruginibacter paludis]